MGFWRVRESEINRNENLVDLHHICHFFFIFLKILVPNSLPLLWSYCRSDSWVLLTFPQTKETYLSCAWNAIWFPQTRNFLPIHKCWTRLVQAMVRAELQSTAGVSRPVPPPVTPPQCPRCIDIAGEAHSQVSPIAFSITVSDMTPTILSQGFTDSQVGSGKRNMCWDLTISVLMFLPFPSQVEAEFWLD